MVDQNRLVQTFIELVKIDSPSGEEQAVAKEIAKRIKVLGGKAEFDTYGNLIAKFGGIGNPIMLNTHMDTVEPGRGIKPILDGDKITSDGATVLGGDPKAGISIILEAITSLKEQRATHLPVEVVLTREEESGLYGAINLDYARLESKRGIVFDSDEEVHKIVVEAPGYIRIDATITGRSAHAGIEPEKGISAIQIASKIISQLDLGRLDHETTANIGIISGGSARNAVPEQVEVKGEVRSRDKQKLLNRAEKIDAVFRQVLSEFPQASLQLDMKQEFEGFKLQSGHKSVALACSVLESLSLTPTLHASGGGFDANIFHQNGVEVVAVGTGVYGAHTTREYVMIPQMIQAANFAEKILLP